MQSFFDIDWHNIILPDMPVLEIFIRGSLTYLIIFCLLRFVLRRQAGSMGTSDLLVIVMIADAAQNGMAGDYKSVPDGILLVCTLIFWNVTLDWLGYKFPIFEKFLSPPPLKLIDAGQFLYRNMRKQLVTEEDLRSQMRLQGIDDLALIKHACMEGDGKISIVKVDNDDDCKNLDVNKAAH